MATGLQSGLPDARAMESVWTTIYFDEAGPGRIRVRLVGQVYGSEEDSKKPRTFFAKGNAYALSKHFAVSKGNGKDGS
jgi:hypothetical protein